MTRGRFMKRGRDLYLLLISLHGSQLVTIGTNKASVTVCLLKHTGVWKTHPPPLSCSELTRSFLSGLPRGGGDDHAACTPPRVARELFLSSAAFSYSGADLTYPSCALFTQDIVVRTLAFQS